MQSAGECVRPSGVDIDKQRSFAALQADIAAARAHMYASISAVGQMEFVAHVRPAVVEHSPPAKAGNLGICYRLPDVGVCKCT